MAAGILTNINGVWRNVTPALVNINGIWRESDVMINTGGIWRKQYDREIEESDIVGFRLVYKLNERASHPEYPELKSNKAVPAEVQLTGETVGYMDLSEKGIIFRYVREGYKDDPPWEGWKNEGLLQYEGHLYAVLTDDSIVDIPSSSTPATDHIQPYGSIPYNMCNRFSNLRITMEAWVTYESYGYCMRGWNNLFYKDSFLDPTEYPDKEYHKNLKRLNSYVILPIEDREETFDSVASIGIARNMTMEFVNMVGSYGALSHTVFNIMVNEVAKPFVIELYN